MIEINGLAYNKLIHDGYMHWKEKKLLTPPIHEKQMLGRYLSFISY